MNGRFQCNRIPFRISCIYEPPNNQFCLDDPGMGHVNIANFSRSDAVELSFVKLHAGDTQTEFSNCICVHLWLYKYPEPPSMRAHQSP